MADDMQAQETSSKLEHAERAVDSAFITGKVDRADITRSAQLDAAEAVTLAGSAIVADEAADEAAKLTVIATNMGDRERIKIARERERAARKEAKVQHAEATKAAKKAYDAIKFSDPSKLGFMRVVQFIFGAHIVLTLATLIFTSRDTVVYSSVNIINWIMVVLECVAFWFFVNRYKIGRPFVIGMAIFGIAANIISGLVKGTITSFDLDMSNLYYLFLALYFAFSQRVKAVLVNDLSLEQGVDSSQDFVIERSGWPFIRNLLIYFVIFSVLGHWMEAGMCQFIRLGWVQGEYDESNTMLWRDWLYPYPMEGIAVVLIAVLLYPLFQKLKAKYPKTYPQKLIPYVLSFLANALVCTAIEFFCGLMWNANLQNWDYTNMPFNFMGQICLQNALAFGAAASIIAWYVYPLMERYIARVRPAVMNIVCVVVLGIGAILFSLYLVLPPKELDMGENAERNQQKEKEQIELIESNLGFVDSLIDSAQADAEKATELSDEQRSEINRRLDEIDHKGDELREYLREIETAA